jgi:hypothetical protein
LINWHPLLRVSNGVGEGSWLAVLPVSVRLLVSWLCSSVIGAELGRILFSGSSSFLGIIELNWGQVQADLGLNIHWSQKSLLLRKDSQTLYSLLDLVSAITDFVLLAQIVKSSSLALLSIAQFCLLASFVTGQWTNNILALSPRSSVGLAGLHGLHSGSVVSLGYFEPEFNYLLRDEGEEVVDRDMLEVWVIEAAEPHEDLFICILLPLVISFLALLKPFVVEVSETLGCWLELLSSCQVNEHLVITIEKGE